MFLDLDGKKTENPALDVLLRSVPDRAPKGDWYIQLGHTEADSVEADARPDGLYNLAFVDGTVIRDATKPVSGAELREILAAFHAGGKSWRGRVQWQAPGAAISRKAAPRIPWATIRAWLPVAFPVLLVAGSFFGFNFGWLDFGSYLSFDPAKIPMPAIFDSIPARMFLLFFLACVLLFLIAVIVKSVETRMASRWPSVLGRITRSERGIGVHKGMDGDIPQDIRIADIAYVYKVGGRDYVGKRINLAERIDEQDIPKLLAQYPVGQTVKVFYKRDNPHESVLDRNAPDGMLAGCLIMLAYGVAFLLAAMWLVTHGGDYIRLVLPRSNPPLLIIPLLVGLGFLFAFFASRKSLSKALRYPRVEGVVTDHQIQSFEKREKRQSNNRTQHYTRTMYAPKVTYRYQVGGETFTNRRVAFGMDEAGSESFAQKVLARFPIGTKVDVFYNPENPEDAGLEVRIGWTWVLLIPALLALGFALLFSGLLDIPAFQPKIK